MSGIWHDRQLAGVHRIAKIWIFDPRVIFCIVFLLFAISSNSVANPLPEEPIVIPEINQSSTTIESLLANNTSNSTANDLYVIKAVVYEIGILTDADNSTNDTTERHEEVNLSFYDPPHTKDGLLDLSGIPVPKIVATTEKNE